MRKERKMNKWKSLVNKVRKSTWIKNGKREQDEDVEELSEESKERYLNKINGKWEKDVVEEFSEEKKKVLELKNGKREKDEVLEEFSEESKEKYLNKKS